MRDDQRVISFVAQFQHVTDAMNLGDQRAFIRGNSKARAQSPGSERILESLHQFVNSFACACRDRDAAGKPLRVRLRKLSIRQTIDLVEYDQGLLDRKSTRLNSSHV